MVLKVGYEKVDDSVVGTAEDEVTGVELEVLVALYRGQAAGKYVSIVQLLRYSYGYSLLVGLH